VETLACALTYRFNIRIFSFKKWWKLPSGPLPIYHIKIVHSWG